MFKGRQKKKKERKYFSFLGEKNFVYVTSGKTFYLVPYLRKIASCHHNANTYSASFKGGI
jgi:peptidase E